MKRQHCLFRLLFLFRWIWICHAFATIRWVFLLLFILRQNADSLMRTLHVVIVRVDAPSLSLSLSHRPHRPDVRSGIARPSAPHTPEICIRYTHVLSTAWRCCYATDGSGNRRDTGRPHRRTPVRSARPVRRDPFRTGRPPGCRIRLRPTSVSHPSDGSRACRNCDANGVENCKMNRCNDEMTWRKTKRISVMLYFFTLCLISRSFDDQMITYYYHVDEMCARFGAGKKRATFRCQFFFNKSLSSSRSPRSEKFCLALLLLFFFWCCRTKRHKSSVI